MFREIRRSERNLENTYKKSEEKGYLKIKPKEQHSDEEWNAMFMELIESMIADA